jgi:hypothetical protein
MKTMRKKFAVVIVLIGVLSTVGGSTLVRHILNATPSSTVELKNETPKDVAVYVAFGSDSVVLPTAWSSFCHSSTTLTCSFTLNASSTQELPANGYLNATVTFGGTGVTCGSTKAELNVNNPNWYDIVDISLVDGYSNDVAIDITDVVGDAGTTKLGPPKGMLGNSKLFGVFPLGCDICVARQNPPCGMKPGTDGCKTGTQSNPDVPCQFQGATKSGGSKIRVSLLPTAN